MTLWIILINSTVVSVIGLATAGVNEQIYRELRVHRRIRYSKGLIFLLSLLSLCNVVLWTRYAFDVGDWRFAAIAGVPFVIGWIGRLAIRASQEDRQPPPSNKPAKPAAR